MPDSEQTTETSFFANSMTKRHFLTPRLLAVVLLVPALLSGAVFWLTNSASNAAMADSGPLAEQARSVEVGVLPAKFQDSYEKSRAYTGTLVARRRSQLAFERPGKILRMLVDEGAVVRQGEPLAELDQRHLRANRRRVAAQLAVAEAQLAELEKGPREQTIAAARAEVRSLAATRDVAQRNLERRRKLVETVAISREEYDESLFDYRASEARVDVSQKALDELEAGTRQEQLDAQVARVEQLQAELADVDHDLEDAVLTAPFAGAIANRRLDDGAIVAAGAAVVDLIENQHLEAWMGLPPQAAAGLAVGNEANLIVDGKKLLATVKAIRPELDPATRSQTVVFELTQDAVGTAAPVAGQVARVFLTEIVNQAGVWVPTESLRPRKRGLWAVSVIENKEGQSVVGLRDVELLHTEGERSFVRGAIAEGDQVIATGVHRVVEGQAVRAASSSG